MKYNKIFRTLAVAFTLVLLAAALPATPALAQYYNLDVLPDDGEIGDEFEVFGSGFAASTSYDIYFSGDRASVGEDIDDDVINYEYLGYVYTDINGTFVGDYFDVPNYLTDGEDEEKVRGGTYYIYATRRNYEEIKARVEFAVEAVGVIELDPDEGAVGTEVEITGEDFDEEEDITVEYDGRDIDIESGDDATDDDGEFTCTVIIPESIAGDHTITVIGDDSDIEAEAEFTVEPEITISPESGISGDTITVSGTGFGDEVDFEVFFDGEEMADDETDDDGSFEVTFVVPQALTPGSYDVEVEDDDDNSDKVKFTIAAPAVSLSPATGYAGIEVTVSGTGFSVSKAITIKFNNVLVTTTPSAISTDANGGFSGSFKVPAGLAGTYTVEVTDGTYSATTGFVSTTDATISQETSAASPGYIGMELTITGSGFKPNATVTITYTTAPVVLATVATDANGAFSATFKVPPSQYGEHTITASDGTTTKQFTFIMESTPPSIPAPLKPEMGIKAKAEAYFDWGDVTDTSGVTYTLQIASDEDFTSIVLEKKDLTDSEYTITKEEKLESVSKKAPYYWRVKAIDGASNEGQWTGAGSFYVGFQWPQWAIYTLFSIGALLLGILGFWVGRKTSYYYA